MLCTRNGAQMLLKSSSISESALLDQSEVTFSVKSSMQISVDAEQTYRHHVSCAGLKRSESPHTERKIKNRVVLELQELNELWTVAVRGGGGRVRGATLTGRKFSVTQMSPIARINTRCHCQTVSNSGGC